MLSICKSWLRPTSFDPKNITLGMVPLINVNVTYLESTRICLALNPTNEPPACRLALEKVMRRLAKWLSLRPGDLAPHLERASLLFVGLPFGCVSNTVQVD